MSIIFQEFIRSENQSERLNALSHLVLEEDTSENSLYLWLVLSLLPSVEERIVIAKNLKITEKPSCSWPLFSYFLRDPDSQVSSAAINAISNFQGRLLGHRILYYLQNKTLTVQTLSALCSYASLARDVRFVSFLSKQIFSDPTISPSLYAKLLSAFFRSRVQDEKAILFSKKILTEEMLNHRISHEAALPAFLYLHCVLSQEEFSLIFSPHLYRMKNFELLSLVHRFCSRQGLASSEKEDLTERDLDWAILSEGFQRRDEKLLKIWVETVPQTSNFVRKLLCSFEDLDFCFKAAPEVLYDCLTVHDIYHKDSPVKEFWDRIFANTLNKNNLTEFISMQIFITEKYLIESEFDPSFFSVCETELLVRIKKSIQELKSSSLQNFFDAIYDSVLAGCLSPEFITELYFCFASAKTSWPISVIALTAPQVDLKVVAKGIQDELERVKKMMTESNISLEMYLAHVLCRFLAILNGSPRFHAKVTYRTFALLKELTQSIQALLGEISESRSILHWHATIQACLHSKIENRHEVCKVLSEALHHSPHVEKRWFIRALVKIDTPESIRNVIAVGLHSPDLLEHTARELIFSQDREAVSSLIKLISKRTLKDSLKLFILENLSDQFPKDSLRELKALLSLNLSPAVYDKVQFIILKFLKLQEESGPTKIYEMSSWLDIELGLRKHVFSYNKLSFDVRTTLKTAELIYLQSLSWNTEAMDLSPVINTFTKAVELNLREEFESSIETFLRASDLPRRLDKLGYNIGHEGRMEEFETYLGQKPLIKEIPLFSHSKLRKMLKGLCLFRAGRRFTFDGPKAFGLFFLIASRRECPFGLSSLFSLSYFKSDEELFQFVSDLHILQDARNRSVHEGLTTDAQSQIESIRQLSFKVLNTSLAILSELKSNKSVTPFY